MEIEYEKNGKKIYQKSFSIIREETNLSSFKKDEEKIVVRIIHACGMTEIHKKIFIIYSQITIRREHSHFHLSGNEWDIDF